VNFAHSREGAVNDDRLPSLEAKLEEYWQTLDPLFDWTPAEKMSRSAAFLRREVLPRREAVLSIAHEIEELNNSSMAAQHAEVTRQQAAFRSDLHKLLWLSLPLGVVVAITAVIRLRLRIMERRSEEQRAMAEEAERQMRALSQQLVAAQEEERKHLSRELHDHVGQVLTALRMELGRIERLRPPDAGILMQRSPSVVSSWTIWSEQCGTLLLDYGLVCWMILAFNQRSSGMYVTSATGARYTGNFR